MVKILQVNKKIEAKIKKFSLAKNLAGYTNLGLSLANQTL